MARIPGLSFSVSATTRGPREGEVNGVDYHFKTKAEFVELRDTGGLLEHASVYDNFYGTPAAPVDQALAQGDSILLDIDLLGARQVRAARPDSVHVFLLPPSIEVLRRRLRARGTDSDEVIARRMELTAAQLAGVGEFDYLVLNDDLDTAHAAFQAVLVAELCRRDRRDSWVRRFS